MTDKLSMALDDIIKKEGKPKKGSRRTPTGQGKPTGRRNPRVDGRTRSSEIPATLSSARGRRGGRVNTGRVDKATSHKNNRSPISNGSNQRGGYIQSAASGRKASSSRFHPKSRGQKPTNRENYEITIVNDRMNTKTHESRGGVTVKPSWRSRAVPPMVAGGGALDMYDHAEAEYGNSSGHRGRPTLERYRAPPLSRGLSTQRHLRGGQSMEDITYSTPIRKP